MTSNPDKNIQLDDHGSATRLLLNDDGGTEIQDCQLSCFKVCFMAFYAVLCPVHLFCLGITIVFDTVCLVKEGASLVNCTEKVILVQPQPVVIVSYLTALVNTVVVLSTLYFKPHGIEFCGFRNAAKKLIKKGSFWSLNITLICVIIEYIIVTWKDLSAVNTALTVTVVLFKASRLLVAYSINYLLPVKFPTVDERSCARLSVWMAYWITLVMFFLDTAHCAIAMTLNVAEKVTPLGNIKPGSHDFGVVAHLVLLGIKATFEARLFLFYWNKFFHGDKDLFSSAASLKSIKAQSHINIRGRGPDGGNKRTLVQTI